MPAKEPRPPSHFRLKLGGHETVGVFQKIEGLDSETEVAEHKMVDDNGNPVVRKVAGATKWSNVTLSRGVDENADLWKWRETVINEGPDAARIEATIEMLDYKGSPIVSYQLQQAWPIKYSGATLDATSNSVALETLVICHEGCKRM